MKDIETNWTLLLAVILLMAIGAPGVSATAEEREDEHTANEHSSYTVGSKALEAAGDPFVAQMHVIHDDDGDSTSSSCSCSAGWGPWTDECSKECDAVGETGNGYACCIKLKWNNAPDTCTCTCTADYNECKVLAESYGAGDGYEISNRER